MLSLQYLQNLIVPANGIQDITENSQVIESAAGIDGIIAAIQKKETGMSLCSNMTMWVFSTFYRAE
jgi:hypothetical protein